MRMRTGLVALAVALGLSVAPGAAEDLTYRNERFGTSATFPTTLFPSALPIPAEEDGRGWASPEGADIYIYARANNGGETPRSIVNARSGVDDVTYSRTGERWAVVSGFRDGRIFYERYIFRGDLVHSVSIRYPEEVRQTYDPIVGPVTLTLRGSGRSS